MYNRTTLIVAAIIIAAASFYAGLYVAGIRNPIGVLSGSSSSISGQVTAIDASSISIKGDDGSVQTFEVAQDANIVAPAPPVPVTRASVVPGVNVLVFTERNKITLIQVIPQNPAPAVSPEEN